MIFQKEGSSTEIDALSRCELNLTSRLTPGDIVCREAAEPKSSAKPVWLNNIITGWSDSPERFDER